MRFIICEKYKFAFVPIAKNASTSLTFWFYELMEETFDPDNPVLEVNLTISEFNRKFKDFFLFTCVRDPFSRLISCFLNKFVSPNFQDGIRLKRINEVKAFQQSIETVRLIEEKAEQDFAAEYDKGITFEMFLKIIEPRFAVDNPYFDPHWGLQSHLGAFSKIFYDFVCRFEELEGGMKFVQERVGIPKERTFNKTINQGRLVTADWSAGYLGDIPASELNIMPQCRNAPDSAFYNEPGIKIVSEKFRQDIEYLRYSEPILSVKEIMA